MFLENGVSVLLHDALGLVLDPVGKVNDEERGLRHARLLKVLRLGVLVVQLLTPVLVRTVRHLMTDVMV